MVEFISKIPLVENRIDTENRQGYTGLARTDDGSFILEAHSKYSYEMF